MNLNHFLSVRVSCYTMGRFTSKWQPITDVIIVCDIEFQINGREDFFRTIFYVKKVNYFNHK